MSGNKKKKHESFSHEAIVKALFENYESIYAVDAETSSFRCFRESDEYSSLRLEDSGEDFFRLKAKNIEAVYLEDRDFISRMVSKDGLLAALSKDKFFSVVYRLVVEDKPLYHKLRATMGTVEGRPHFLIGIRNVDDDFRQDKALAEQLSFMHRKEINHLEAILASAEGYIEANLSKDTIIEFLPYRPPAAIPKSFHIQAEERSLSYSAFEKWYIDHMVVENKDKYAKICDRNYLIECFGNGEKRAVVTFSVKDPDGRIKPCRIIFYLYRDTPSEDILAFCVLYDLTEEQRKEKRTSGYGK